MTRQDDCLRALAHGPLKRFPRGFAHNRDSRIFAQATAQVLVDGGFARLGEQGLRLSPAGFALVRERGWLPALAKLAKGDSHSAAGGEP